MTLTLVGRHVEPDNDGEVLIFNRDTLPASARLGDGESWRRSPPAPTSAAVAAPSCGAAGVASELTDDEVREERADMLPILFGTSRCWSRSRSSTCWPRCCS